jgi:hypothetical protein
MHCPNCGTEVSDDANFCRSCGDKIQFGTSEDSGKSFDWVTGEPQNNAQNKSEDNISPADSSTQPDRSTGNGDSDSQEAMAESADNESEEAASSLLSRRNLLHGIGVIGTVGVAGAGTYSELRKREKIIPAKKHDGVAEYPFTLNDWTYTGVDTPPDIERPRPPKRFRQMVYRMDDGPVIYKSKVLPPGKYYLVSFNFRLQLNGTKYYFFRKTHKPLEVETTTVAERIDELETEFREEATGRITADSEDERVLGANINRRAIDTSDWNLRLEYESRIEEALTRPIIKRSSETLQQRFQDMVQRHKQWRTGLTIPYYVQQAIGGDNPAKNRGNFVSKFADLFTEYAGLPDDAADLIVDRIEFAPDLDVRITAYGLEPTLDTQHTGSVPIGFAIHIRDSSPVVDKDTSIYSPTVDMPTKLTDGDVTPRWKPAVGNIERYLTTKFTDINS